MPATPARDDASAEAFDRFHRAVHTQAARYAATILGPRRFDALDDVLQEAWTKAWRGWDTCDPDHRQGWFLRIVRNCCIDVHRSHRPTEALAASDELDAAGVQPPAVDQIEDGIVARLDSDRTFTLLGRLPAPLREALWLREVVDLSYAEIAELQGVPVGTVMSRLHTARRRAARVLRRSS